MSLMEIQALRMATLFDGISQQLDFTREEGSSSDNSSEDYTSRIRSPRICSPRHGSPNSACRTPRMQRHRSRSNTVPSPLQCTSPIPYATWKKLRLCDSPSTPKVGNTSQGIQDRLFQRSSLIFFKFYFIFWWMLNLNQSNLSIINFIFLFCSLEPAIQVVPAFLQH